MRLAVSASTIKSWFQYRCERKTRYETMPYDERDSIPILRDKIERPWAMLGNEYEKQVIENLSSCKSILRPSSGEEYLSQSMSVAFLENSRHEEYAYQLVLEQTPTLNQLIQLPNNVKVRRSIADVIHIDRTAADPVFRVIDIKAVQHATTFHKAQVAFYSLMLKATLADLNLSGSVAATGQIWHMPNTTSGEGAYDVEEFRLQPYERLVIDFFRNEVPEIAQKIVRPGQDDTFFHIYFKCEQCEYLRHCTRAIDEGLRPEDRDVSAIPGVSHESKRSLHRFGLTTVGKVADLLGNKQRSELESWGLRRRADALSMRAKALINGDVARLADVVTYLMPPRVDVGLHLVVDVDPVDNNIAAIGYLYSEKGHDRFEVEVLAGGNPEQESAALRKVLGRLIQDLTAIDRHNRDNEDSPDRQIQAHIFLYEPSEAKGLQEAVARHLENPQIRAGLLHLIRMFPPENVVPEPEFRGVHHLPATALRSVFEQVYALPVMVSYDLRQVTEALARTDRGFNDPYRPDKEFKREFSSRLSVDVCRQMRDGQFDPKLVEEDVRRRLRSIRALTTWLWAENEDAARQEGGRAFLRLNKKPFRFQATFDPLNAVDLDVLQAFELLEDRSGLLNTLITLALPFAQRRDSARCIAQMTHKKSWKTDWGQYSMVFGVPRESQDNELTSDNFNLILTNDDPDIRLNPQLWPLHRVRIAPEKPEYGGRTVLVNVTADVYEGAEFQRLLRNAQESGGWFLDQTYKNFTAERAANFLSYLGGM